MTHTRECDRLSPLARDECERQRHERRLHTVLVDEWHGQRGKDGVRRWGRLERAQRTAAASERFEQERREQEWAADPDAPPDRGRTVELRARLLEDALLSEEAVRNATRTVMAQRELADAQSDKPLNWTDIDTVFDPLDSVARDSRTGAYGDPWKTGYTFETPRPRKPRAKHYKPTPRRAFDDRQCAEPGCQNRVVGQRKNARYCELHRSDAARAARTRARRRASRESVSRR